MTYYTKQIQDELIAQLNDKNISVLDFSSYEYPQDVEVPPVLLAEHTVPGPVVHAPDCRILGYPVDVSVRSVAVLPNGLIVSASEDRTLRVWDLNSGTCIKVLKGHTGYVYSLAVLPNGQVVSASEDRTLRVWDIDSGTCTKMLCGHRGPVRSVIVLPNGHVVSGGYELRVWDVNSGICLAVFDETTHFMHGSGVERMMLNAPDDVGDGWILTEGYEPEIGMKAYRYWDMYNWQSHSNKKFDRKEPEPSKFRHMFDFPNYLGVVRHVFNLTILPNGSRIGEGCNQVIERTGCKDYRRNGTLRYIPKETSLSFEDRLNDKKEDTEKTFYLNPGMSIAGIIVAISNDQVVFSAANDKYEEYLIILDIKREIFTKRFHVNVNQVNKRVSCITAFPNGQVVSGCNDGTLIIWTPFPRLSYEMIAPVLTAASKPGFLFNLSCQGVDLGQAGYEHVLRLARTVPSLKKINVTDTGLSVNQISEIQQALEEKQRQQSQRTSSKFSAGAVPAHNQASLALVSKQKIEAKVLYTYEATETDQLTVKQGSWVEVLEEYATGWWLCQQGQGQGFVPKDYLQKGPRTGSQNSPAPSPHQVPSSPQAPAVDEVTYSNALLSQHWKVQQTDLTKQVQVGQGGCGTVYKAKWKGTTVAVKKLNGHLNQQAIAELTREARMMSSLHHPHVIHLFGVTTSAPYYLIMEWMGKGSLYDVIRKEALSFEKQVKIMKQAAKGLAFLHSKDIIHRDMKSLNVLVDKHYHAKVADFGLSTVKRTTRASGRVSDSLVGTLHWKAPELFKLGAKHTKESDVYSLGMVLWEAVSGKLPYEVAEDDDQIKIHVREGGREEIPTIVPQWYKTLIERCWSAIPSDRPTAAEVAQLLKQGLQQQPATYNTSSHSSNPRVAASQNLSTYSSNLYGNSQPIRQARGTPTRGSHIGRGQSSFQSSGGSARTKFFPLPQLDTPPEELSTKSDGQVRKTTDPLQPKNQNPSRRNYRGPG